MFGLNNSSPRSDSFSMIGFHFISSELSNRVVHIAFAPSCSLALKNPILRPEVYVKMLSRLPRFFNAYFLSPTLSLHFFHLANTHVHQHSNSNGKPLLLVLCHLTAKLQAPTAQPSFPAKTAFELRAHEN